MVRDGHVVDVAFMYSIAAALLTVVLYIAHQPGRQDGTKLKLDWERLYQQLHLHWIRAGVRLPPLALRPARLKLYLHWCSRESYVLTAKTCCHC
jgi:hypothetical protein